MKNMKYVGSHETTKGATMKNSFEIQNATADFSDSQIASASWTRAR